MDEGADAERIARYYATAARFDAWRAGRITFEELQRYAIERERKACERETAEALDRLEEIAAAETPECFSVYVEWKRSKVWGYNPTADCYAIGEHTTGRASGCGYDKRSAAVAEALNAMPGIVKVLCELYERGLEAGEDGTPDRVVYYGAGHGAIPAFVGGVGVSCFWHILEKAGYTVKEYTRGNNSEVYTIERTA